MNFWFVARVVLVAAAGVTGLLVSEDPAMAELTIGWEVVLVSFLFFPAIAIVGFLVTRLILREQLEFKRPSWDRSPFNLARPEEFLHVAAYALIATGLGQCLRAFYSAYQPGSLELAPIALGLGILIGLRLLAGLAGEAVPSDP